MSSPRIEYFLFDEENEKEISAHGLSIYQVFQLLDNVHIIMPNRKQRRGEFPLIGRDNSGICISVPIEPTHKSGLWRPIPRGLLKKAKKQY